MKAVVGGGIAGLAAAYRLRQQGHDIRLFEAGPPEALGGLARTYETAGDDVEQFYHHLSKTEETIVELAGELGLADRIEWRIGKNAYYVDGVVHPLDKPWEILAYPHLSLYDKFRLGLLLLEIDIRSGIPSFDTYNDLTAFEDVPVREFLLEHTTRRVYEGFWEPLLRAKFGNRKDDVSAAWLLGRIKFRGERDLLRGEELGYPRGGFAPLIQALVEAVGRERIETHARVTGVTIEGGSVDSITVDHDPGDEPDVSEGRAADGGNASQVSRARNGTMRYTADDVVVATMPNVLEELTGYTCEIDFQGAVCATVWMEEPLTDTYWLNIAHEAPFGALIEHTNFVPPERYGGDHLLYLASYVQSPDEDNWQADDATLKDRWLGHVKEMFPEFDPKEVTRFRVARAPRAAPIYERGYLDTVIPYHLEGPVAEGLYYAGMASRAQYPERSLNGGVVAGFACADRIDSADQ